MSRVVHWASHQVSHPCCRLVSRARGQYIRSAISAAVWWRLRRVDSYLVRLLPAQPTSQPSGVPCSVPLVCHRANLQVSHKRCRLVRLLAVQPTSQPTGSTPIGQSLNQISGQPSVLRSGTVVKESSGQPSGEVTGLLTSQPSGVPSSTPTDQSLGQPSGQPSVLPSGEPSEGSV